MRFGGKDCILCKIGKGLFAGAFLGFVFVWAASTVIAPTNIPAAPAATAMGSGSGSGGSPAVELLGSGDVKITTGPESGIGSGSR